MLLFDGFDIDSSEGFKTSAVGLFCSFYHPFNNLISKIFFFAVRKMGEKWH